MILSVRQKGNATIYHEECKFEDLLSQMSEERPRESYLEEPYACSLN